MTAAVLEGEVIEPVRRRDRNAARTPDVLPPDVDTKVVALSRLDSPELQTRAVTTMLNHARTGLLAAIAAQDLPQIVEFKRKAAAIQEIAKQVRLGKDMQLDAAEFVRRAERGLGVAIREGQARGEIATPSSAAREREYRKHGVVLPNGGLPSALDFAKPSELSGADHKIGGIYAMTDGVSDEAFEEALADARAEGNLSRANVARRSKAKSEVASGRNLDDPRHDENVLPEPPSAQPKRRLTKHDSTEMLANINGMLNGIVESIAFINPAEIDADENRPAIDNIRHSMGSIRKLLKEITNG